ncbi:MAG: hypothetical protein R3B72_46115 [Polyangiaceae bacterium]
MKACAWVSVATMAAVGLGLTGACGDGGGDTSSGSGGGASADCTPTDPACPAVGITSDCLSLVDNTGLDQFALRLSQLSVKAPEALTNPFVYGIVSQGVNINLPACNINTGKGTFNMLTIFDKTADTLTLAGAYPEASPADGYCIVDDMASEVAPITVTANLQADGSFSTDPIPRIVVPIFLDISGDLGSAVFLPLREGRITGGQLSADQNCIGRFNGDKLDPAFECAADPNDVEFFENGASLDGFITLEDADEVIVELTNQSLCVLLSGDYKTYGDGMMPNRCLRDGGGAITLKGDWCSTTNAAGGCQDAFHLEAEVASSGAALKASCP